MNNQLDKKSAGLLLYTQHLNEFSAAFSYAPDTGHIIECGVGTGRTMRWLTRLTDKPIHGFDSFEGLPEDWVMSDDIIHPKGSFAAPKEIVPYLQKRPQIKLHIGWFKDTLPIWKENYPGIIAFLHIDADLYSSCVTVLAELNKQIVPDTVILFDEFYETDRYKYWEQGEYKAFCEWQEKYNRKAHQLTEGAEGQASFRIIK
jgi:hypothetical protein